MATKACSHPVWSAQADGITLFCVSCGEPHPLSAVANAKLIAAAPLLADALEAWRTAYRDAVVAGAPDSYHAEDVRAIKALRAAGRLP